MKSISGSTKITYGYSSLLLLWFVLWLSAGDIWWGLTLLNRVVPYLFWPTPFLTFWAIRQRQRRQLAAACIPILVFGYLYWPYYTPRFANGPSPANLRVMSYNILYSNSDDQAIANIIRSYQPDLVALQEVQPAMMTALAAALHDQYPYSMIGFEHPYGTTAAFSRYPLIDAYVLDLQADRPAIVLRLKVHNRSITFITAHLLAYGLQWVPWHRIPEAVEHQTAQQQRQAALILQELARNSDDIVILACDCNSQETAGSYRILNSTMFNAAREVGWRINAPAIAHAQQDAELQHIDYIFYRGAVSPRMVHTIRDTGGSDHQPVLAELSLLN